MLKDFDFKKLLPDAAAIVAFLLIVFFFFQPLFDGKQLKQADIKNHVGMSKEIADFRDVHKGEEPLWTNSMFGGMPAYQISVIYGTNFLKFIDDNIFRAKLPRPADYLFLYMIGFFVLLRTLKLDTWMSLVGAVAFAFSSYFIIILEAGHNSKAHAIGYMAPTLAFIILTFRGKYLAGGILTALFFGLQVYANHPQITYYLGLIILILGVAELVKSVKEKAVPRFLKATGVLIVAAGLAIAANFGPLLTTLEYSPYTIRGKAELTFDQHDKSTSGLDKGYATQWSYGKGESFSLLIPNAKGGATGYLGQSENALKKIDPQLRQNVAQQNHYWGDQPFTSGPVYVGAIVVFLFVLGLFIVRTELRWVLLAATILSLMLGWGKNMMWFTDLFLDYFPAYNKFRAVSMILVIAQLSMAVLAMLALKEVVENPKIIKEKAKYFYISLGLTAGLSLLFYSMPGVFFNFHSQEEIRQLPEIIAQYPPEQAPAIQMVFDATTDARISVFKADAIRSFFFIVFAAGLLLFSAYKKIPRVAVVAGLGLLIAIDIISVDSRYLSKDNYERKSKKGLSFQPTQADLQILQDKDPNFRVFNLTVSPFNDASTSYFHKSIGGYHGAKLRRYQDLIDYHIGKFNMEVINMLNTKYFIQQTNDGQVIVQPNYSALGNAWFVDDVVWTKNANEEISQLGDLIEITNLTDGNFSVYGRQMKKTDTIMKSESIEIRMLKEDNVIGNIDLSRIMLAPGMEYTLGYNPEDTTEGFIHLSNVEKPELVEAKQFRVRLLSSFSPRTEAVVDEQFKPQLANWKKGSGAGGTIKLLSYAPNRLEYESENTSEALAVFSEIYYPKGWKAFIDGNEVGHIRTNYVLRGLMIPAGKHKIEFKFEPSTYYLGTKINFAASLIILLMVLFLGFWYFKQRGQTETKS